MLSTSVLSSRWEAASRVSMLCWPPGPEAISIEFIAPCPAITASCMRPPRPSAAMRGISLVMSSRRSAPSYRTGSRSARFRTAVTLALRWNAPLWSTAEWMTSDSGNIRGGRNSPTSSARSAAASKRW
jgi:hypothetical protein